MSFSKLRKIHVIIIGCVLCVIAGVAQYFLLIKPKMEAYKVAEARYNAAVVLGNPQAENKAIADRNDALANKAVAEQKLQVQMERRMPDLSFARRDLGMIAYWKEILRKMGPLLQSFAHDPKMDQVYAQFVLPAPPINPNDPLFDRPIIGYELGNVTVVGGSFKAVLNNIRRWNNCRRLVMIGPPVLDGSSPKLRAAYSATCYVFPVAQGGPQIPMAGMSTGQPQP
jgi:hypothetical protein